MRLRLLLTTHCNRNCSGCCNKEWDLSNLPVEKHYSDYEMIMITGGEPLLFPIELGLLFYDIRMVTSAPIYVYTAKLDDPDLFIDILRHSDGITLTIHEQKDVHDFIKLIEKIEPYMIQGKSMRLNIFKDAEMPANLIPYYWDYKYIEWISNCPLPDGEVFKRVETLA